MVSLYLTSKENECFDPVLLYGQHGNNNRIEYSKNNPITSRAIYIADGHAYTLGINKAYEELTGISQDQVLGKNLIELENIFFRPSVTLRVLRERKPVTIPQQILTSNKNFIVTGNPIFDQSGNIELVVTLVQPLLSSVGTVIQPDNTGSFFGDTMIVASPIMQQVLNRTVRVAAIEGTVLLMGESGCGKELIARTIHDLSKRKNQPFISINAASIPESLFESELFGYVGGAFTGARYTGNKGLVKAANGGTLFLDEISEMSLGTQAKLLRLLENREIVPLGSSRVEKFDVRVLTATNKNLLEMVREGQFRQDLYYRLNILNIHIPPLRDRKEDIVALSQHFLDELNKRYKIRKKLDHEALYILQSYSWPGNVRELKCLVDRMALLHSNDMITAEDVERELSDPSNKSLGYMLENVAERESLTGAVFGFEKKIISEALKKYSNVYEAAKALGVHRTTLLRKIKRYHLP